jgi:hypothetical protein
VAQWKWATWSRWKGVAHFAVSSPQDTFICKTCSTSEGSLKGETFYHLVHREQECRATVKQWDIFKVVFDDQDGPCISCSHV